MNTILLLSLAIPILITIVVVVMLRRGGVFGMSAAKKEQAAELLQSGRKARARILRIDPTGMVINNINIQCLVTFQLEPLSGGAPFTQQKKIVIPQTAMPRVGDLWPAWYDATDPALFVVGMPDGAQPEQIPTFREFGIPHPLDPTTGTGPQTATGDRSDPVADLERLTQLRASGALTDEEFRAAKSKLLGE